MGLFGKKPPDKRAQYRVGVRTDAPIHAVLVRGDRMVSTELLDISARGCGLRIEAADGKGMEEGQSLDLRFTAQGIGRAVVAVGLVRRLELGEAEGWVNLGLEFEDPEGIYAQLNAKLWSFFNRRQGFRVTPMLGPGKRVPVTLELPGGERTELLNDLSAIGLSIRVSKADELQIEAACRVVLALPGQSDPFRLQVRPVHHTRTPTSLRVGFSVDREATEDFDAQHEALTRYLLEAQRQILRRERGGGA